MRRFITFEPKEDKIIRGAAYVAMLLSGLTFLGEDFRSDIIRGAAHAALLGLTVQGSCHSLN